MPRLLAFLFSCLWIGACVAPDSGYGISASEGSAESATPGRVTFIDYGDFLRLNLVNFAHSDPVEYYSEVRATASTKITYNEVFSAMIDYFDEQGFNTVAKPGYAPVTAGRGALQALEVETEDGIKFLSYGTRASEQERRTFRECVIAWQQVFNRTQQSQAVSNTTGGALFENQRTNTSHKLR